MGRRFDRPKGFMVTIVAGAAGTEYATLEGAARAAVRGARGRRCPPVVMRRRLFEHGQVGDWREVPEAEWRAVVAAKEGAL
jgi:hypothetical protein